MTKPDRCGFDLASNNRSPLDSTGFAVDRRSALGLLSTGLATTGLLTTLSQIGAVSGRPVRAADGPSAPAVGGFPAAPGKHLSGELVYIDAINRRAGLRLAGDPNRYSSGPPHWFALLPYASVWRHGSRGELRDVPLGSQVHGYFVPPPAGEAATIPPLPDDKRQFAIPENHALLLEDDFSFYQRRGQAWKVESIDLAKEKIRLLPIVVAPSAPNAVGGAAVRTARPPGAGEPGELVKNGIREPYTFDIDLRTDVWSGGRLVEPSSVRSGMVVQFNLAWSQGWGQQEFRVGELWIDDEGRRAAGERQRRRHLQYERERWTAGWIDRLEHFDYGGGEMTLTLFDVDPEILDDLYQDRAERIAVAVSHKTRRTWFHRSDRKFAKLVEWKKIDAPPLGSSGVQLRLKFVELLAGYTPGAIVRVKAERWKFVTMPPEERLTSAADLERAERMTTPW